MVALPEAGASLTDFAADFDCLEDGDCRWPRCVFVGVFVEEWQIARGPQTHFGQSFTVGYTQAITVQRCGGSSTHSHPVEPTEFAVTSFFGAEGFENGHLRGASIAAKTSYESRDGGKKTSQLEEAKWREIPVLSVPVGNDLNRGRKKRLPKRLFRKGWRPRPRGLISFKDGPLPE